MDLYRNPYARVAPRNVTIVTSFVAAILFGLYLASFMHCIRWLLFQDDGWRVRRKVNRTLASTTLLIFFLSTISVSTTTTRGISPDLITYRGSSVPAYKWVVAILDSVCAVNDPSIHWLVYFQQHAIYLSILIIIDSVLIHRCWIVFSKNWFIVCLPLALWCFCLIFAIMSFSCDLASLLYAANPVNPTYQILCTVWERFPGGGMELLAFYICNILVSIYTTSALVYKVWCAAKENVGANSLYRICRILTESGILYTLSSLSYLAYLIKCRTIYTSVTITNDSLLGLEFLLSIEKPISSLIPGIAFNLVTIRVGEQRARGKDNWVDSGDSSEVVMSSVQQEQESIDLGQEKYEGVDEGVYRDQQN